MFKFLKRAWELLAPDDGVAPPMNVEPEEEEEEVVYVSSPEEAIEVPERKEEEGKKEESASIADIIRQTQESNLTQQEKLIQNIGDVIGKNKEVPEQKKSETREEYLKRIEDGIYGKNAVGAIEEVVTNLAGPIIQGQQKYISTLEDRILKNDPSEGKFYSKYKDEIDQKFEGLSSQQKLQPGVREKLLNQVKFEHQDDIIADKVAEAVKLALEAQGVESSGNENVGIQQGQKTYINSTGVRAVNTGVKRQRKVFVPPYVRQEAEMSGIDDVEAYYESLKRAGRA